LNKNQQGDIFQRLSPMLLPRTSKKQRLNPSLEREMWRTASSLELLPVGVKTQLGDALLERMRKNEFVESGLWCVSRLGARQLFYGPNNLVVPAATAARWVDALLKINKAEDAITAVARQTGDSSRDLPPNALELIRRKFPDLDLEAEDREDLGAMGRVFGEELPSGLVLSEPTA
jgi:hypothetical protein